MYTMARQISRDSPACAILDLPCTAQDLVLTIHPNEATFASLVRRENDPVTGQDHATLLRGPGALESESALPTNAKRGAGLAGLGQSVGAMVQVTGPDKQARLLV